MDIGRLCLAADPLVLEMYKYDVIPGMYWLVTYRAMVDCYTRTIAFAIPRQDKFLVAMPRPEGRACIYITSRRRLLRVLLSH